MQSPLAFNAAQLPSRPHRRLVLVAWLLVMPLVFSGLLPATPATADDGSRNLGARVGTPEGFGAGVTGGAGGDTYWVTSLADSGAGTLRAGLAQGGPTWIRFKVSGTITLQSPLRPPSNVTIDGRGQQVRITVDRDITAIKIGDVANIIIHNLILFGDKATRNTDDQPRSDAINILGGDRIWIDHNDLSGWGDKLIDMSLVDRATVSYNAFHDAAPGHAILIGTRSTASQLDNTAVTVHHNTFRKIPDRSPRIGDGGRAHVYNNYVDSWSYYGMKAIRGAQLLAENNIFGPAATRKAISATEGDKEPGDVRADGNLLLDDSLRIEQHNRNTVFTPRYSYTLEAATTSLRDRLLANAGWHDGSAPDIETPTNDPSPEPSPDPTTDPSPEPSPSPTPEPPPTSDTTPPTVATPNAAVAGTGTVTGPSALPLEVTWSATDDTGVAHYELEHSIDGEPFTAVQVADPRATAATVDAAPDRVHRFRVTAVDGSGNRGTATSPPTTLALHQETAADVTLNGTWRIGRPDAALGGAHAVSRQTGDVATFRFRGDSVSWVSTERRNRGVAEVRLDGQVVATVDLYRADSRWRSIVWRGTGLAPDVEHTLEVVVTGARDAAATDDRVDVDAFLVSSGGAVPRTPPSTTRPTARLLSGETTIDSTVPALVSWQGEAGDATIDRFTLQHSVDGGAFTDVALSSPTDTAVVVGLQPGVAHTFRVRATDVEGDSSPFVAGSATVVDLHQEDDAAVVRTGEWELWSPDWALDGGHALSTDPSGTARLTFRGTAVAWIGSTYLNRGIATVHLDGERVATVDLSTVERRPRRVLFAAAGLAPDTEHVLELRPTGTSSSSATDTRIGLDAFAVLD